MWSNIGGAKKASIAHEGNSDWLEAKPAPKGIWLPAVLHGRRSRHGPGRNRPN
jgi:hypothetical protein